MAAVSSRSDLKLCEFCALTVRRREPRTNWRVDVEIARSYEDDEQKKERRNEDFDRDKKLKTTPNGVGGGV